MENFRAKYNVDKLKELYTEYSLISSPVKAVLLNDTVPSSGDDSNFQPNLVKVWWNYRDPVQLKSISFQKNYRFSPDHKAYDIGLPEELSNEILLQANSKNEKKFAILKSKPDSKSSKSEQYIVVYDNKKIIKTIDVKSICDQMTIIENANLAGFVLNEDGTILLCVVEVSDKSKSKEESSASSKDYDINYHEYRQSWGEKFSTIYHTSILAVNLETNKHILIDKVGVSLCQPFFYKSLDKSFSVGCIGFQELPYKLGLIYCTNRMSALYGSKLSTDFSDVSPHEPELYYSGDFALTSPRVYHSKANGYDNKALLLERNAGGAHNKSARLTQFCFDTRKSKTLIDNKEKRKFNNESGRIVYSDYGPLFVSDLPKNCFTLDGKYLVLSSDTPITTKAFVVNLEDGKISLLNFPLAFCQILDVKNNWLVAIGSSIDVLPNVYICKFDPDKHTKLVWSPIEDLNSKKLDKIKYETFAFPSRDNKDKYVTCIWTTPADNELKLGPTMVIPHGGPHSQFRLNYYQSVALFTELGLKTCLVNYVGSTGVDDDYGDALLGAVGTSDVHDVYDAIDYVIKYKCADKNGIILNGGSHGGFLVTSISGQNPELNFLACISRNPVIDIASLVAVSDIPDWCICEALGGSERVPYTDIYARTSQNASTMHEVSPIAHVQHVKVPTLLLLGKDDLRVPHSQGLMYHRLLKARGIETRCLIYDDVHDLYKINVDFDCFINIAMFIEKFIYYNS